MDMNIRNIAPELLSHLKVSATRQGMTLRDYVISILEADRDTPIEYPVQSVSCVPIHDVPIPKTVPESPATIYSRPGHSSTCSCFTCKPPK